LIEQAIYGAQGSGGYRFLARSPGFREDWLTNAERLCTGFGERPAGVTCPGSVFALPFGSEHVAVVQAADQGQDDAGRPGALGFRILALPRTLYADLLADPFRIADAFPAPWQTQGLLLTLEWTSGLPEAPTVAALQKVLDVSYSATLLGGVQALLDGSRLVFERNSPEPHLLRGLWALLPFRSRMDLWPTTFCFQNHHGFHVVVTPRADGPAYAGYLHEAQAGDYPEGRYELNLQIAVESGNQQDLEALLARRSRSQTWRMAVALLAVFILMPIVALLIGPNPPPVPQPASTPTPTAPLQLPPIEDYPSLAEAERTDLAQSLQTLGKERNLALQPSNTPESLTAALAALDAHLGTPERKRDPGPLAKLGPLQRQVRALLWKQGVADYNDRGLNTVELLERLRSSLARQQAPREGSHERQGK
jgi:hypothetical protein